jgi:hypothetical protein
MGFTQALGSGTLISKATLDKATRQQQDQYGYGFTIGQEPVPNYGHGGGAPGMNGDLRVFPQLGCVVVVILSNLDPPAGSSLADFFTLRMPDQ